MPKSPAPNRNETPSKGLLTPRPKDPVNELFYMLGFLRGQGIENAPRITELVNDLVEARPAEEV
jgi:hypothetical protein